MIDQILIKSYFCWEKMVKNVGNIRIKIALKFWDLIHIKELFLVKKNDKKWGNIRMKIGSKMVKHG